jgi:CYTH domain-containing protein
MPDLLPESGAISGVEIERKYRLRAAPDAATLAAHGSAARRLEQVYLAEPPAGRRVRRIEHADGTVEHRLTRKVQLRAFAFAEDEERIDAARYGALLLEADPARSPIRKVRHVVPHGGQVLEIDVFEAPPGLVLLEVELASDDESVSLPDWLGEWRDVTGEPAYLNANLARLDAEIPEWAATAGGGRVSSPR